MGFASGFHRLAFFFGIASCGVWFYAFNEWWGLWAAVLLCVPVGLLTTMIVPMLIGTLRQIRGVPDAALTFPLMIAGVAVAAYGLVAAEGVARWLIAWAGAALFVSGAGLFQMRMNAMRYRASIGGATDEDIEFLRDMDRSRDY